VMHGK